MLFVLFNKLANNGTGEKSAHDYLDPLIGTDVEYTDVTEIDDIKAMIEPLGEDDRVILAGGDGTINKFINALDGAVPRCAIDYIPTGSGNDFKKDVGIDGFIRLNDYIKDLPTVTVKGESYKFINGIGYGIDGYCCEVGDDLKAKSDKPVNYTAIAIKGLLFHHKTSTATVIVDGVEYKFKKAWLAATMKGRFYGGGMMVAPAQDRHAEDGKVTLVVWHGTGKLVTLMHFPKIFKGEHIKYKKSIKVFTGHDITVRFSRPTALQIDGETVRGVTEYSVSTGKAKE